jgi:hypothetical protein
MKVQKGCVPKGGDRVVQTGKPGTTTNAGNANNGSNPKVDSNGKVIVYDNPTGTGGGNEEGGKNCPSYEDFSSTVNRARVCKAVYDHYTATKRDPYSNTSLNDSCIRAAKNCGPVKMDIERGKFPKQISELEAELKRLQKERTKLIARRKSIDAACPDCKAISDGSDRPTLGDYIVGGLNAVSPMVIAGIGAGSYNRYLKTNLAGYNSYLNNSLQNCQAYIAQGTTLGVPSSPCQSNMWSGGVAMPPGGGAGGFGIYGAMGFPGGGMYGGGNMYGAGYGAYGYGGPGAIGMAIGSMYGGQMGGGMYAGGYGQIGGGLYAGQIGSGYGYGSINGGYGQIGGGYGQIGMAMGGGYGMYGGQMGAGYGYGSINGGYGQMGGMYAGQIGMAVGGGYGYGADPSMQLNAQRAQMQQQNMQISQQQIMEAQARFQAVSSGGGYGMSYGGGYGGYGMSYGGGYAGYGMSYGGYGGGPSVIGTAIGSLYGTSY